MNPIPWDTPLRLRSGAWENMCGITIFYDFPWTAVFKHDRAQFRNGKCLAKLVKKSCPKGKIPALLLTRKPDVLEGSRDANREGKEYRITIVNIDKYLDKASGDAATTYFAMLMPSDIISAASIDWSQISKADIETVLNKHIDVELLRKWLHTDPEHVNALLQLLSECTIDPKVLVRGRESQVAAILPEQIGDQFWKAIEQAGTQLPDALAHKRLWSIRNARVDEFRLHLDKNDWLEPDWQRFFEKNTWIFGYGLKYQFLHLLEAKPEFGGKDVSGKGSQEGDYLFATAAETKFTVLVEIKRPNTDLVIDTKYRNRTYKFGEDLTGGVAQLQQQCWRWAIEGSKSDENRDLLESQGIFTHDPKGILVIGNSSAIRDNRDKIRTFESFRRNLHNPEIITFDELLYRAECSVAAYAVETIPSGGTT